MVLNALTGADGQFAVFRCVESYVSTNFELEEMKSGNSSGNDK